MDIYEKLPVPFGLVRFGVAPDHPEVKVSADFLPLPTCLNAMVSAGQAVGLMARFDPGLLCWSSPSVSSKP